MDAFTIVRGPAAPLMLPDVNTDVISPGHTGKGSLALSAFAPLRYLPDGRDDPSFVLNRDPFRGAPILLAAQNFGCGSSRESAVWSLRAIGVRCVIATSFGDIFFGNCFLNGVLPIVLDGAVLATLAEEAADGSPSKWTFGRPLSGRHVVRAFHSRSIPYEDASYLRASTTSTPDCNGARRSGPSSARIASGDPGSTR